MLRRTAMTMDLPEFSTEDIAEFGDLTAVGARERAYKKLFAKHRSQRSRWDPLDTDWNGPLHAKINEFLREQMNIQKVARKQERELASNPYAYLVTGRNEGGERG
jgi:hypothetical protein